jgi:carbamoyl-phosphate synthase large subunit
MHPAIWTAASRLVDIFYQIPPARDAETYIQALLDICRSEQVQYLITLTDIEIDVLSPMRSTFSSVGTVLCLPGHDAISICRDKLKIHETFQDDSLITTIPTWEMDNPTSLITTFPLIAKPRSGRSSEGLVHIRDESEFSHHMTRLRGATYILQPLLEGQVHVTDIVRQQTSGRSAAMSRKELLRTVNGAGLTVETIHDEVLNRQAQHIAERLNLNGCINIEFLTYKGRPHLMDINPRFSAGIAFTKLAGYDMITNHLRCFSGELIEECILPPATIYTRRYVEMPMEPITPIDQTT